MGITALPCFIAGKLVYPDGENNAANNSVDSSIDKSILTLDGQESIAVASTSAVQLRAALRYAEESQRRLAAIPLGERIEVARLVLTEYAKRREEVAWGLARVRGMVAKDTYWMSDVLIEWARDIDTLVAVAFGSTTGSPSGSRGLDLSLSAKAGYEGDTLSYKSKGKAALFSSSTMDGPSAVTAICHGIVTGTHLIVRPSGRDAVTHYAYETLHAHGLGHFGQLVRWPSSDPSMEILNRQLLNNVSQNLIFSSDETFKELLTGAASASAKTLDDLTRRSKRYGTGLPLAIVTAGADLGRAARDLVEGARLGGGRFCLSFGPVLVEASFKEELCSLLKEEAQKLRGGDLLSPATDLSAMDSQELAAYNRTVDSFGGRRLFGEISPAAMDVLLATDVPQESACLYQEFPGTMLSLITVSGLEEAAKLASESLKKNSRDAWTAVAFFGDEDGFEAVKRDIESYRYLLGGVAARVKLLLPHQGSFFGLDLVRRVTEERS